MFDAYELQALLRVAHSPLRAMLLLGVNCGFGNHDIALLPIDALDLENGWVNYPRPKTGVDRRCPLWKETVAAVPEAIAERPRPTDPVNERLVFLTKFGAPWTRTNSDRVLSKEMAKLLKSTKVKRPGKRANEPVYRKGVAFYSLRHTFATIAGEALDQAAVDHVMGHARDDMASVYREQISDDRLTRVTDHVHRWLFDVQPKKPKMKRTRPPQTKRSAPK